MHNLLAPAALVMSLALGSAALAAPATPAAHAAAPAKTTTATHAKQQSCEASWKAQKTHNSTHEAYMKSCVAKG